MRQFDFRRGDRVYRYVWTGGEEHQPQPLTIEAIKATYVRVRTDAGSIFNINPVEIVGPVDWEEPSK